MMWYLMVKDKPFMEITKKDLEYFKEIQKKYSNKNIKIKYVSKFKKNTK